MTSLAPPVQRGRKYDQVLQGARVVFMADGFDGASMDNIAQAAGVSKATLYSYFADKKFLFTEVAQQECRRQADMAMHEIDMEASPTEVLTAVGLRLSGFIFSDFGQRIFRICVAESDRFPEIGQEFYVTGPAMVNGLMVEYLTAATERGELKIEDFSLAAGQFAELTKADMFPRMAFGITRTFSSDEIERVVVSAVEVFLARYGV